MTREEKLEKVLRYIAWLTDDGADCSAAMAMYIGELALRVTSNDDDLDALIRVIDEPEELAT